MSTKKYYIKQSYFTNPGKLSFFFDDLPQDINLLIPIVRDLILHKNDGNLLGYPIPLNRLSEIESRSMHDILSNIIRLQNTSLLEQRVLSQRTIGCCRDFSLLLCSILRHQKIPARLRYGFTTVQLPGFYHDQVLLEYWNEQDQRWCLADARLNQSVIKKYHLKVDFHLHDIPREKFFTAGEAWYLCRSKQKNPKKFGAEIYKKISGLWYVRNKLMQDIAALCKVELLLWDCWGWMLSDVMDEEQLAVLDLVAQLICDPEFDLATLKKYFFKNQNLRVPDKVCSYSPVSSTEMINPNVHHQLILR